MNIKNLLFGFLALFLISKNCRSQIVADTALANAISSACPACIDLSTQNLTPYAITLDSLSLDVLGNTSSFDGLQYLTGLTKFKMQVSFWNIYDYNSNLFGFNGFPYFYLPPNLSYLTIHDNVNPDWATYMYGIELNLPQSLTHLELRGFNPDTLNLPPNLEHLNLSWMYPIITQYPPTLKEIIFDEVINGSANFIEIPSSVERLTFSLTTGAVPYFSLGTINIISSNSNLRYLKYVDYNFSTAFYHIDYTSFPNLDTLIAQQVQSTFIDSFPQNLKYLKLESIYNFNLNIITNQLSSLKKLILLNTGDPNATLVLPNNIDSLVYIQSYTTGAPFTFNSILPDSLKYLTVKSYPSNICFSTLPQGLLRLESSFKYNVGNVFNACLPNHPPQLQVTHNNIPISPPLCGTAAPNCYSFEAPIVTGICFLDLNGNTLYDGFGEPLLAHPIRREEVSTGVLSYLYPNNNNVYGFYDFLDTSSAYIYDVVNTYPYYNPPAATSISTTNLSAQHYMLNMPFTPSQNFDDIEIAYVNTHSFNPGFTNYISAVVRNRGTNNVNGDYTATLDPLLTVFNPNGGTVNGNTISFSITNLAPGQYQQNNFHTYTNTTAQFGDTVYLNFNANILGNDIDTSNNVYTIDAPVMAAYDPNDIRVDKSILSSADVQQDAYLTYTIRFQNTGNAPAFNVYLTDSLSIYLDPAYFETIFSSHPNYQIQFVNTNDPIKPYLLKVIYDNINLPDSTANEADSHGVFVFKIKVKNNTNLGSIIPAKAAIYFDYSPAVITNLATTLVMDPTNNKNYGNLNTSSYLAPNPANETVQIMINSSFNGLLNLNYYDNIGQLIKKQQKQMVKGQNLFEQSLVELKPGIYLINITTLEGKIIGAHKLIKL